MGSKTLKSFLEIKWISKTIQIKSKSTEIMFWKSSKLEKQEGMFGNLSDFFPLNGGKFSPRILPGENFSLGFDWWKNFPSVFLGWQIFLLDNHIQNDIRINKKWRILFSIASEFPLWTRYYVSQALKIDQTITIYVWKKFRRRNFHCFSMPPKAEFFFFSLSKKWKKSTVNA